MYARFTIIIFSAVIAFFVNARNYYDACKYHLKDNVRTYKIIDSDGYVEEVEFSHDGKELSKNGDDIYDHDKLGYPVSSKVGLFMITYVFEDPKQHKSADELRLKAKLAVERELYTYNECGELIKTEFYKKSLESIFSDEEPHFTVNKIYNVFQVITTAIGQNVA